MNMISNFHIFLVSKGIQDIQERRDIAMQFAILQYKRWTLVIWVVEFPREGYKIIHILVQKLTYSKEIIVIFLIEIVASRRKIGHNLRK